MAISFPMTPTMIWDFHYRPEVSWSQPFAKWVKGSASTFFLKENLLLCYSMRVQYD